MKKLILLFILLPLIGLSQSSVHTSISIGGYDVIYLGLETPISIAVAGIPKNEIFVKTLDANITGSDGEFKIRPTKKGSIVLEILHNQTVIDKKTIEVKLIPDPQSYIGNYTGDVNTSIEEIFELNCIEAKIPNFPIPLEFEVLSFQVSFESYDSTTNKKLFHTLENPQSCFTKEALNALSKANVQGAIYISNINVGFEVNGVSRTAMLRRLTLRLGDDIQNQLESERKVVSIQKEKLFSKDIELRDQKIIIYLAVSVAVLISILLYFIYRGYQMKKKDNVLLNQQKTKIEQAHREITDSINYAKRIQTAILPPQKVVREYLNDSFILYKPKDIVAGDFYWMESIGGKILFAAADCTGHGVPGAMVSVVCNNGLNRSVREFGLSDPSDILDKTREIVIQEFEKSDEDVKDGMDIAICSIEGNTLKYAGAHNPLWLIRNNEILETKADKQPIGKFDNPTPYQTHIYELQKNDTIYIFSDGYVDQFGGENGKKFKAKALRELLLSINEKSMDEQRNILDLTFEAWRGENEQIDDICIIGVRV